jgi:hypothetical protein
MEQLAAYGEVESLTVRIKPDAAASDDGVSVSAVPQRCSFRMALGEKALGEKALGEKGVG